MTVASDLRQAAIDIFNAMTGVPIVASYISVDSTPYVAGGDITKSEGVHSLRIIQENRNELAMAIAGEASSSDEKYLFVTSELPISAAKDDRIEFNGNSYVIVNFENDAVGAVTTLYLRSA